MYHIPTGFYSGFLPATKIYTKSMLIPTPGRYVETRNSVGGRRPRLPLRIVVGVAYRSAVGFFPSQSSILIYYYKRPVNKIATILMLIPIRGRYVEI